MIQLSESSSATRISKASVKPRRRAFSCERAGSFPARIEIKTMLSMPRTISSAVSVRSPIQICGSESQSMIYPAHSRTMPHLRHPAAESEK